MTKGIGSRGSNSRCAGGQINPVLMCPTLPGLTLLLNACANEPGPVATHVTIDG